MHMSHYIIKYSIIPKQFDPQNWFAVVKLDNKSAKDKMLVVMPTLFLFTHKWTTVKRTSLTSLEMVAALSVGVRLTFILLRFNVHAGH